MIRAYPSLLTVILTGLLLILAPTPAVPAAPAAPAALADADPVGVWPLRPTPEVVHGFDPPADPWGAGHRGVDLAGTVGQSVHSTLAGTVSFVGKIAGKPVVTISHGALRTTYEPVTSDLEVGAEVAAGARIGTLTVPFSHCFPAACLHWGLIRGETYLDPLSLVGSGRVRLLPLWRDEPVDHGAGNSSAGASAYTGLPTVSLPALPYANWLPLIVAAAVREPHPEPTECGSPSLPPGAYLSQARGCA